MTSGNHGSKTFELTPFTVMGIGICPLLAASKGLAEAMALGVGMVVVQMLTIILLAPVRRMILPGAAPFFIVITAGGFATAWSSAGVAFFPDLFSSLSLYIMLLPSVLPILCTAQWLNQTEAPGKGAFACIKTAALTCALLLFIGMIRELFGLGTLLKIVVFRHAPLLWLLTIPGGLTVAAFSLYAYSALGYRKNKSGDAS